LTVEPEVRVARAANSATIRIFCSAVQTRQRPDPVNTSSLRTGSAENFCRATHARHPSGAYRVRIAYQTQGRCAANASVDECVNLGHQSAAQSADRLLTTDAVKGAYAVTVTKAAGLAGERWMTRPRSRLPSTPVRLGGGGSATLVATMVPRAVAGRFGLPLTRIHRHFHHAHPHLLSVQPRRPAFPLRATSRQERRGRGLDADRRRQRQPPLRLGGSILGQERRKHRVARELLIPTINAQLEPEPTVILVIVAPVVVLLTLVEVDPGFGTG
jgi:hypothetical protein